MVFLTYEEHKKQYFNRNKDQIDGYEQLMIKSCLNDRKLTKDDKEYFVREMNITESYLPLEKRVKILSERKELIDSYLKISLRKYNRQKDRKELYADIFTVIKWLGVSRFAQKIGLTRMGIYEALTRENANPRDTTLGKIFDVLNIQTFLFVEDENEKKNQAYSYAPAFA